MAGQSDGFWYDFTKTDRLFQENTGPTPAAAASDVIGLALSQRTSGGQTLAQVVSAATEIIPDPGFDSSGAWTMTTPSGTTSVVAGGQLTLTRDGVAASDPRAVSTGVATSGRLYRVEFDVVSRTSASNNIGLRVDAVSYFGLTSIGAVGRKVFYIAPTSSGVVGVTHGGAGPSTLVIDNFSVKEVSRYPAVQATTSLKPKFQTTGAAFDGSDDNLLTGYMAGAGANFIVAKVTIPASIPATQVIAGSWSVGVATDAAYLALATNGQLRRGVGTSAASSGPDLRGTTADIGISWNGATIRAFAVSSQVEEVAQAGVSNTNTPFRVGAMNGFATAANFFAGSIKAIVAGRQFLDLATFNKIAAAL